MTKTQFLKGTDNECNDFVNLHGVKYEHLPRQVRSRLKQLSQSAYAAMPGDVAYDMAMNDKGAAIDRATHKAGQIVNERGAYIRQEFARLLERKGVFA